MPSLVEQVVGKIFKPLVSLAMEVIVIWIPLEKQVVGKLRPKRKFFQLLILFVIKMVVNWLSLEKQVVGKWRQGRGEVGEGNNMGRSAEWKALLLPMSIIYCCCFVIS